MTLRRHHESAVCALVPQVQERFRTDLLCTEALSEESTATLLSQRVKTGIQATEGICEINKY